MLTFCDTDKKFQLNGDLLKMITNKNYNLDLANLTDEKIVFDFAKEMYFDGRALGNKSVWKKLPIRLIKLRAIMAESLKESKARWCDEICGRLKFSIKKTSLN